MTRTCDLQVRKRILGVRQDEEIWELIGLARPLAQAAVRPFARTWTLELQPRRIRVNVLSPWTMAGLRTTAIVCFAIEVLWLLERTDRADVLEANLREKTLKPDFRYVQVDARLSLARLCALTGRESEARDWFAAARHVLDEQGALPLRAVVDLDEARMERRLGEAGDHARAEALLSARERFAALGVSGWLRRAHELAARS